MREDWKEYSYGNLDYKVSNYGRVIGVGRNRELKQRLDGNGYVAVTMGDMKHRSRIRIHRVVAKLFVDNPHGLNEVNHIDRDRSNPRADNLEWTTHKENIAHSHKLGAYKNNGKGESNPKHRLTEKQVLEIRELYASGTTQKELSKIFNVGWSTIHNIVFNLTWRHLL